MYFEFLNNFKKRTNKKLIEKWKNRIIRLSLFLYSKFRNSEISAFLNLVVPNVDPRPLIPVLFTGVDEKTFQLEQFRFV